MFSSRTMAHTHILLWKLHRDSYVNSQNKNNLALVILNLSWRAYNLSIDDTVWSAATRVDWIARIVMVAEVRAVEVGETVSVATKRKHFLVSDHMI
jgi:hypothetical protein